MEPIEEIRIMAKAFTKPATLAPTPQEGMSKLRWCSYCQKEVLIAAKGYPNVRIVCRECGNGGLSAIEDRESRKYNPTRRYPY